MPAAKSILSPGSSINKISTVSLNRSADSIATWRADERIAGQTAPGGRSAQIASPAVHTIELRKDFRGTVALRGLSMTVGRGEVFGFLGPNGAGKTTAVKLLLGLIRPSSGEAMVLGAPAGDRGTRGRIGYLPELFRYQGWLSRARGPDFALPALAHLARRISGRHRRLPRNRRPFRTGRRQGRYVLQRDATAPWAGRCPPGPS